MREKVNVIEKILYVSNFFPIIFHILNLEHFKSRKPAGSSACPAFRRTPSPSETWAQERRVACTPATTALLVKKGFTVNVQEGAGKLANFRWGTLSAPVAISGN